MESDDDLTPFLAVAETNVSSGHSPSSWLSPLWNSGTLTISLSALVCSTIPLSIKQLHGSVHAVEVTFISSLISWCLTALWLLGSGDELQSLYSHRLNLLVLRGMLAAVTNCLYYTSIQMLPMSSAVALFFTNPAMAVLLEWLLNGKRLNLGTIAGCVSSIAGVYLISHPTCDWSGRPGVGGLAFAFASEHTHLLGIVFCLVAALANAGGYVCVHCIGPDVPSQVLMWWYHTLVTLGSAASLAHGVPVLLPNWQQVGWILAVAAAHFAGQLLLNRGFSMEDASHGSALFAQQVLYSYVWHLTVLHGRAELCAVLGSAAILLGVLFVTESSGMNHALQTLESQRTQSQVIRRLTSGRMSFVERLRSSPKLRITSLPPRAEAGQLSSPAPYAVLPGAASAPAAASRTWRPVGAV